MVRLAAADPRQRRLATGSVDVYTFVGDVLEAQGNWPRR